jgi:hypothetical protein
MEGTVLLLRGKCIITSVADMSRFSVSCSAFLEHADLVSEEK